MSPFLLSAMIKHHIKKYREQYPAAIEMLDTCLYVHDGIRSADDISQALKISKVADNIMKMLASNYANGIHMIKP
ncbi:hypothetical protein NPIL_425011 [Nephila pilipes]|uniref:Uncharacterized protein n=1 Tax=Nephila pilipes TaxID=299642 RepID=A0A8X6MTW4_NEPPI|nr:hypothetical protein NPIL_425011 [Nephila pilipes]